MNRLQIVQKYMSFRVLDKYPDKYARAQKLSQKISEQQDKKIAEDMKRYPKLFC